MRPLHVVLVIKTVHGGLWTVPILAELQDRGHRITAVLPAGEGPLRRMLRDQGVRVVTSAFDFRFRPRLAAVRGLVALRRQLRELAPDVVHYHLYASAIAARLATAWMPVPRVHMVAGPLYLESRLVRAIERVLVRLDTTTICGSTATAYAYRRLGRSTGTTPVIPYGVDINRFRPSEATARRSARAELGVGPSTLVVVMVALVYAPKTLVHRGRGIKGHDVLMDAWDRFRRARPDAHLVLVGGGFDEPGRRHHRTLQRRYARVLAGDDVTWIDTCDDVRRWYATADLSVSPSLSENHGAALEAGAMGVPGIVSDAGALPETVGPGSGWVVPRDDADALSRALAAAYDEHRAGRLADRGQRAREHTAVAFDRRSCAASVAGVIEDVAMRRTSYSLFCEARFRRNGDGRWDTGGTSWRRYTLLGGSVDVVARATPAAGPVETIEPNVNLRRLPYYVGMTGLIRAAVPLAVAVVGAVRGSRSVVLRLPGVVGFLAGVVCKVERRRYAVEVVGDPEAVLAVGSLGRPGRLLAGAAGAGTRWLVRGADAALYATRTALQERYPPRPDVRAVGMANVVLHPEAFVTRPRAWDPQNLRIVAVGSQEQHYKGHDTLLYAIRALRDRGVAAEAVIVGGGRAHAWLADLSQTLGLAGVVSLPGEIHDRARLLAVLDSAAVFAMPSRTEGMPRALIEAMARGLPAVGTDVGGIPELLDPEWIVPIDDSTALAEALERLLTSQELREEQSRRSLEVAQAYRLDRLEDRFTSWLAEVPPATARSGR